MKDNLRLNDALKIAKLANIFLSDKEKDSIIYQFEEILKYFTSLEKINTNNIFSINNITDLKNIFREDKVKKSLTQEEALKMTNNKYNGYFKTSEIIFET